MQQTGRVTIKLGNDTLMSKPGASLQTGGIDRDFDISDQLTAYYKEKGRVSMIKATLVHIAETDLVKLRQFKDGTAFFQTDTAHTYTIANAGTAELGELANGEVEITIGGDPASE